MSYLLPMEKMKIKKNQKLLKISRLYKTHWNTLWKIIGGGMENAVNSPFIILKKRQTYTLAFGKAFVYKGFPKRTQVRQ